MTTFNQLREAKEMSVKYYSIVEQLSEDEKFEHFLLIFRLEDSADVLMAFRDAIFSHWNMPMPVGDADDETGEMKEPYKNERPLLYDFVTDVSLYLGASIENHLAAAETILAQRPAKTAEVAPENAAASGVSA